MNACSAPSSSGALPNITTQAAQRQAKSPDLITSGGNCDANTCSVDADSGDGVGAGGDDGTSPIGTCGMAHRDAMSGHVSPDEIACGGGSGGTPIAVHPGPTDGQTCNGSKLSIGDNVGAVDGHPETVVDINEIATAAGMPFTTGNGSLGVNTNNAGWIYKDGNGNFWIQSNPEMNWTVSASISAWFLSFGINAPSYTTPMYAGSSAPKMPSGATAQRCFSGGASFA